MTGADVTGTDAKGTDVKGTGVKGTDVTKAPPYRWVVLAAFCGINLTMQTLWIAYAPITGPAAKLYGTSDLAIGVLAMSFMVAFLPLSIPASWVIDTRGFKVGVGVGAALMAVFGPLRGLVGTSYPWVLACTIGLAAAQPFLLNAWTKLPALWFPLGERATAVGVVTLANLVGTAIGMAATPVLIESMSIPTVQTIYGVAAAATSLAFFIFAKEKPAVPVGALGDDARALMLDGLGHALKVKSFLLYGLVMFLGMGVFNGVTTWIEGIVRLRGFGPEEAGTLGAILLVGGLVGAVAIASMSDRRRRRKPFIVLGLLAGIPGLAGLAFAQSFVVMAVSAFELGFFLVSVMPVGMQYASEITRPTPEGTSNGLLQLVGQGSVVFVYVMEALKSPDGSFGPSMIVGMVLLLVAAALALRLLEPEPDAAASVTPVEEPT